MEDAELKDKTQKAARCKRQVDCVVMGDFDETIIPVLSQIKFSANEMLDKAKAILKYKNFDYSVYPQENTQQHYKYLHDEAIRVFKKEYSNELELLLEYLNKPST